MKKNILSLAFLCICAFCFAQKTKVAWGDEFKLHKGSTDLSVLGADNTGVYLEESHLALKSYFVVGASARTSATIVKLDKNLSELYRNDFNKELKGKEFEQFFLLQNRLWLFASDYSSREKTLTVYAAEVDKSSGELSNGWLSIATFEKDSKKDDIDFKLTYNADSTNMVLVSSVTGKEKNTYQVQDFDRSLKPVGKAAVISNEFDPKTFQLEDVLYTVNKTIILVGRVYQYEEGKRKKDKFLDFVNYSIRIYDDRGKQQAEVNTSVNGKWLNSTQLLQEKNKDLVLAAFYSNEKRGKTIDGMLVQRIDPLTGKVISTSEKEINNSLLTETPGDGDANDDNGDETKDERKERESLDKLKDEGEGFSRFMRFRNIFYTTDNGIVLLAENYHHFVQTSSSYSPGFNGGPGSWRTTTQSVYECGELMMCKVNANGDIQWLQVLPKAQREVLASSSYGIYTTPGFFDLGNRPYYAGFGTIHTGNSVNIIFNDNPKNAAVIKAGQKAKRTTRFSKSDCYVVTLDDLTGKLIRNQLFSNTDNPTAMPRLGSVVADDLYIVGKDDRALGKTKIAVAKITAQ